MQVLDALQISAIDLRSPHLIILNINDRSSAGNLATALPDSELAVLYYANARNPQRLIPVLELHGSALGNIYPSADGSSLVYLEEWVSGALSVYVMTLREGFRLRVLSLLESAPFGIQLLPSWSPDGDRFALTLPSNHDMDVYVFEMAGNQWQRYTHGRGVDFHPVWSPDGRTIAYLSALPPCKDLPPATAEPCTRQEPTFPRKGQLHLLDTTTRESRRISEHWIREPPVWLNDAEISFLSETGIDGDSARSIWLADIHTGNLRQLTPGIPAPLSGFENVFWNEEGTAMVLQNAGQENIIWLLASDGSVLGSTAEYHFPRYGMRASWSADHSRVAIGGVEGQCPYGVLVFNQELALISQGTIPPMCEPQYAPDGSFLAFEGINSRLDGRIHVYLASQNGYGTRILTSDLRGQNRLVGWAWAP
ncbi:MAG: hypothetical protein OXG02_07425 [Chloroflexi bacterium]|nr:hypothetical protein [Chloroflexota bacterium]